MGSHRGIEVSLAKRAKLPYVGISTGKLRRYFDLQNLLDLFRIPLGFAQAFLKLGRLKPDVLFSKGGYVAVPVVWAAWLRRIPIVIHESDAAAGLATKLTAPLAQHIFLGYKEAAKSLKKHKSKLSVVGNPIRKDLNKGSKTRAQKLTKFKGRKVLLVMGGSTGSGQLNQLVKDEKDSLTKHYDIIHITGEGKGRARREPHYYALPYAHDEMKDFYALADLAISRAGAGSLAELEATGTPALLYPLGLESSRGDQILNAKALAKKSPAYKIAELQKSAASQLKALKKTKPSPNTAAAKIAATLLHG